ncbi:proline-rich transmembrane protein 1-like [Huso huso]|uniref:Proline-rich transmembrane protein 1-like n=1 Tax=Huso huso TaxID=61971 RepID=A0ABR0Y5K6_HUSHU
MMEEVKERTPPAETYLLWSIINLLCCCFPLGVVAVIYSIRVENAVSVGDVSRAVEASQTAKILNIVGVVTGALALMLIFVMYAVVITRLNQ